MLRAAKASTGEELLALHIRAAKLPVPIRQFKFCATRKWTADFGWLEQKLLVEVDGGNRMAALTKTGKPVAIGRHTLMADYDKMNHAVLLGYRVLRFTPAMIKNGTALIDIERALNAT
jgi:very-short-patch-repair endonuclease